MFQKTKEELEKLGAWITTSEIKQEPELWQELWDSYEKQEKQLQNFLAGLVNQHKRLRVIFTGAGTSAYVGDTILPYLKEVANEDQLDLQAVPSTHLVSNPRQYFKEDVPTLLVSFARSGNSPESIGAVEAGQFLVKDFYQLTITCAPEGQLAQRAQGDSHNYLFLMPERSNDQGFAMTGSFTCMTLASLLVFDPSSLDVKKDYVQQVIALGQRAFGFESVLEGIVKKPFTRLVYLGSGAHAGMGREAQLKILELTAGRIATGFDSSLGFRHGPKSFVDKNTVIFTFVSNDPYTRLYDRDILLELAGDQQALEVVAVEVGAVEEFDGTHLTFDKVHANLPDAYLAVAFVLVGQIFALHASIKVGNLPDTPSPTGTVNRVVKGVTLYPLENK
ncbi:SIS domain-containing protein [Streptococcus sp. NLN76]|uniref:SIS domain-containing protein n=1 Tax=Streptococcus sp. NLN76 TaxID=2822800 RepID=UPI0018AA38F9|nr:SIS domain-containing protein [Streptococcus sp. NLN76]MBF8969728.1 SIS domain-containing protein [Streptococcus sp. NLN76]